MVARADVAVSFTFSTGLPRDAWGAAQPPPFQKAIDLIGAQAVRAVMAAALEADRAHLKNS